jgi:hypothetical protein
MKPASIGLFVLVLFILESCTSGRRSAKMKPPKGSVNACSCARNFSFLDKSIINSCNDSAARNHWINKLTMSGNVKAQAAGDSLEVAFGDSLGAVYTFCKGVKLGGYTNGKRDGRWFVFNADGQPSAIILYMEGAVAMYGICENGKYHTRYSATLWWDK